MSFSISAKLPAVIKSLHDVTRDDETGAITGRTLVYPETVITAVHMPDGRRTVVDEFNELKDDSNVTSFNEDGSITKVMTNSGMIITTEFGDGVITETAVYADETPYYTKTTTFNADGSITTSKVYADNNQDVGGDD